MFSPKHGFCYSLNLMTGPDTESLKAIHSGPQNKISLEFNIESKKIPYLKKISHLGHNSKKSTLC